MPSVQRLSVVLPCYNEGQQIIQTVTDVLAWMDRRGLGGEVIVVDDGSTDASAEYVAEVAQRDPRIRLLRHKQNQGYGAAVRTGCDDAREEWIAFMDSDGQFRPEDIGLLLARAGDAPFVTGRRRKRADPLPRLLFGRLLQGMIWLSFGLWVRDVNCGLKLFRRDVWQQARPVAGLEKFFNTELFLRLKRAGILWIQIDVPHYPRLQGAATGGTAGIILRMFRELGQLRRAMRKESAGSGSDRSSTGHATDVATSTR